VAFFIKKMIWNGRKQTLAKIDGIDAKVFFLDERLFFKKTEISS